MPVSAERTASAPSNGLTLAEAYQQYVDDPTHRWAGRTRQSYDTCRKLALSVIGPDVPMGALGRTHCRDFLGVLRHRPRNANKRFPKLTAREASQRARAKAGPTLIALNELISSLSSATIVRDLTRAQLFAEPLAVYAGIVGGVTDRVDQPSGHAAQAEAVST